MLLESEARTYFSHLPMLHAPHDYHVLMEVELSAAEGDPFDDYVQERSNWALRGRGDVYRSPGHRLTEIAGAQA